MAVFQRTDQSLSFIDDKVEDDSGEEDRESILPRYLALWGRKTTYLSVGNGATEKK